jgi:hypothetical protein
MKVLGGGVLEFFWHFKRMIRGLEIRSAQRFQLIRRYGPSPVRTRHVFRLHCQ